jgi:hypothetical protein
MFGRSRRRRIDARRLHGIADHQYIDDRLFQESRVLLACRRIEYSRCVHTRYRHIGE